jgi:hypothetical protein
MATTTPASAAQENSLFTTVISVAALVAVVLLVYFMARGRTPGSQRVWITNSGCHNSIGVPVDEAALKK